MKLYILKEAIEYITICMNKVRVILKNGSCISSKTLSSLRIFSAIFKCQY